MNRKKYVAHEIETTLHDSPISIFTMNIIIIIMCIVSLKLSITIALSIMKFLLFDTRELQIINILKFQTEITIATYFV